MDSMISCGGEASSVLAEDLGVSNPFGGAAPSVLGEVFFIWRSRCCGLVGVLDGVTGVCLVAPDGDGAAAAGDLDKVVAVMRHRHELS